ncbi:hypothetical protein Droror1_Dr00025191 [Drosera rotundifolia]
MLVPRVASSRLRSLDPRFPETQNQRPQFQGWFPDLAAVQNPPPTWCVIPRSLSTPVSFSFVLLAKFGSRQVRISSSLDPVSASPDSISQFYEIPISNPDLANRLHFDPDFDEARFQKSWFASPVSRSPH